MGMGYLVEMILGCIGINDLIIDKKKNFDWDIWIYMGRFLIAIHISLLEEKVSHVCCSTSLINVARDP